MLEAPRTAKTDGACPPFLTIPEPADAFQSSRGEAAPPLGVSTVRLDTGGQQFAPGKWSSAQMRVPATFEGR